VDRVLYMCKRIIFLVTVSGSCPNTHVSDYKLRWLPVATTTAKEEREREEQVNTNKVGGDTIPITHLGESKTPKLSNPSHCQAPRQRV